MEVTWDVPVPMSDGIKIYADIFRPEGAKGKLPVILTMSPYGKHGPKTFAIFPGSGVPDGWVSKYAAWEGVDPITWTKKGYIVVNGDSRGSWGSESNLEIFSKQESKDGHDLIEWLGTQPWSNGKVGMVGVSYLAIIQWGIAATKPPHLACFMPWEGFTDLYRDYSHHGGIPETKFMDFTMWSCRCGPNYVEDWIKNHEEHPLYDDYHRSKDKYETLSNITAPVYAVIDWGDHGMHTRGCLNGWTGVSSKDKWLEIHGRKKWRYFFEEESVSRQDAFFKKYLKGEESEVDSFPRVRMEVRDRAWQGMFRGENEWPLARTKYTKCYLDSGSMQLGPNEPEETSVASYESTVQDKCVHFTHEFTKDTELTGGMRLRLYVSTEKGDDMDLFVQLDKIGVDGKVAPFVAFSMVDDGPLGLGWLRVSHRELVINRSTTDRPWHPHTRRLLLQPDEVVPVDIEILRTSTLFRPGETLRIKIQGNDCFRQSTPDVVQFHERTVKQGKHYIYSGSSYESYLMLPIID
ncbi:Alpha/Beta hydrolase protein [Fusarium redolens]|uniref:Alpha/Beta hydrolase protein n=1 Tax=Fusarium redolens TaxID=48865 RepID=A0A9P9G6T3_FUSRE|nr:Alpha/Beta hydrolase protein [Fusarium redolens]KAH7232252.1 Alpha/Beta hydrolase protein [Fusarium redolens]